MGNLTPGTEVAYAMFEDGTGIIELLKGCIMELADVVYGDGGEVTA